MLNSTLTILAALTMNSGLFQCPGNPDICDQSVQVFRNGSKITALKVEYVGYCGSMGPYLYPCHDGVCTDGNAQFTLNEQGSYHWKNLGHPFECEFRRADPTPSIR